MAGVASVSATASSAGGRKQSLPDGFIMPFHPGVEFEYALINPGLHSGGLGGTERLGNGYRQPGEYGAFVVVQCQRFGGQRGPGVAAGAQYGHVTSPAHQPLRLQQPTCTG